MTELRTAVDSMRTAAGLGAFAFPDPSLGGLAIKAVHFHELRTAVAAARATLGLSASTFTDPTLSSAISVKAVHVQELRNAVK